MEDKTNFLINLLTSDNKLFDDSSTSLNRILYNNIKTPFVDVNENPITINSNFLIIKKFTGNYADDIYKALSGLYDNIQLVFNNYGNIWIGNIKNYPDTSLLIYVNPLVNKKFDENEKIPDIGSVINTKVIKRPDFLLSPTKKWILTSITNKESINTEKIYFLLYNPFHSKDMSNLYYMSNYDSNFQNIVKKYCAIADDQNKTAPGKRFYADVSCNCLLPEDCIDNGYGIYIKDPTSRNMLGKKCVCVAPYCDTSDELKNSTVDSDSFFHNYKNEQIARNINSDSEVMTNTTEKTYCAMQNNICSVLLNAGGDIKSGDSNIEQKCNSIVFPDSSKNPSTSDNTDSKIVNIVVGILIFFILLLIFTFVFTKKIKIKIVE